MERAVDRSGHLVGGMDDSRALVVGVIGDQDNRNYFQNHKEKEKVIFKKECQQVAHENDYLIRNGNLLKFFRAIPVPRATALRGSSAICTDSLVFCCIRLSSPLSNDPPPAR